jgi:hypothetical protein
LRNRILIVVALLAVNMLLSPAVWLRAEEPVAQPSETLGSLPVPEAVPVYPEAPPIDDKNTPKKYTADTGETESPVRLPPLVDPLYITTKQYVGDPQVKYRENGIVVGQAKLFELRSLQMMIDNVKESLAQTAYPSTPQLFAATGHVQASQTTVTDSNIQGGATIAPAGALSGQTAQAAQASMSSRGGSSSESQVPVSLSPTDTLSEQTSLWYELVNLKMLMDGALSDRLIPADDNGAATTYGNSTQFTQRAQAIIGFQISVDAREEYKNAVAEAIITVDNRNPAASGHGGYGDEPSLMLLLPRSNTYNSVSVSRDSKSLGLGALANVFSLGMSKGKSTDNFYIGKDTDTVALERIPNLDVYGTEEPVFADGLAKYRGVSFGWQFRPVFTRAAVDPGVRQVFASISLPASVLQDRWEGTVNVTTYWRKYNAKSRTAGKVIPGSFNKWKLDNIVVPIGSGIERALQPVIKSASWEDAGGGKVAITIEGSNFSLGTSIACGETIIPEKELSLFSSNRIRFVLPMNAICRGGITIIGRYGVANVKSCMAVDDNPYAGATASKPQFTKLDDQTVAVDLTVSNLQNPYRLTTDRRPVVMLNGDVFGGEKPFTSVTMDEASKSVNIRFCAPMQTVTKTNEMTVCDLLSHAAIAARW